MNGMHFNRDEVGEMHARFNSTRASAGHLPQPNVFG
jgi:hypothetical protein